MIISIQMCFPASATKGSSGKNILLAHLVGWFINIIDRNDVIDDGEGTVYLNVIARGVRCERPG